MPGHPDYDASTVWQAQALYSQASGAIPAPGTNLFAGPITGFPSIQLRGQATAGGFRIRVDYYLDAALTTNLSTQVFDAITGTAFSGVYEVLGPFVKISVDAVTVAPAAAGLLVVIPSRAQPLGWRPNVFPQTLALTAQSIPALSTSTFQFPLLANGMVKLRVVALGTAGALSVSVNFVRWDLSVSFWAMNGEVVTAGEVADLFMGNEPLLWVIQNTTAAPATITASLITQQQGW